MTKTVNLNPNQNQQPKKEIDIKSSKPVVCVECGYDVFVDGTKFRKVSKLLTGTPQDMLFPIQVFLCGSCGAINRELLPEQIKEIETNG